MVMLARVLVANALLGAGLFAHAFLYNFYLGELGYDAALMGVAYAAMTTGGFVALLPAGLLIDRIGARPTYIVTALVAAAGLAWGAFARSPLTIILSAGVAGAGAAGFRVVMGPLLMGLTKPETRSRVFSWNVGLLIASGAVWTLATGAVPGWLQERGFSPLAATRIALLLGALLTLSSGLIAWTFPRVQRAAAAVPKRMGSWIQVMRVPKTVFVLVAIVALWMTAAALVLPFFNVYFQQIHGLSVTRIGVLFSAAQAGTALILIVSGELAVRFGAKRVVIAWMLLFVPALALLPLSVSLPVAFTLYFIQGVVAPVTNPLIDQILLESVAEENRGAMSSWRNAATELSGAAGAGAGGFLLAAHGFPALFASAAVCALIGAGTLALRLNGRSRQTAAVRA